MESGTTQLGITELDEVNACGRILVVCVNITRCHSAHPNESRGFPRVETLDGEDIRGVDI